ncbi:MAG TPA: LuxR C-terminal-related transcriptional regulator [Trebonia sp.]
MRYLALAARGAAPTSPGPHGQAQVLLAIVRLELGRQRGNLAAVADEARRLRAMAEAPEMVLPGLGEDLRGLGLISLGITEVWAAGFEDAGPHLGQGVMLAHRTGRPFLEFTGLAYQAVISLTHSSYAEAAERSRQVIELAQRHGWTDEPPAGIAYAVLGATLAWRGRPEEAEPWMQQAERTLRTEADPAAVAGLSYVRGVIELARGRDADALAALQTAERLAGRLAAPHYLLAPTRALHLHALIRLGETERAEQALAGLGEQDRERGEIRIAVAALRLTQDDPRAATVALAPVLEGAAPLVRRTWPAAAFLLEAIARDALGDEAAAGRALERALELAEPEGALWYFLLRPAPDLFERQARQRTAHASLIAEIRSLLAARLASPPGELRPLREPLTDSEVRVLRYLPTNLSAPEIASELSISWNTVKTHMRNLYTKLGTHRRAEAVERARALGLLAPSPRRR